MVRAELVRRKLAHLSGYLRELQEYAGVTSETYVRPGGPRRAVERLLQLAIETVVDINVHIVTEIEGTPPPDYRASFLGAARCGAISAALADRLAPSAGLRNALVHDYAEIDDLRVHDSISLTLDGFHEFAASVVTWLESYDDTA